MTDEQIIAAADAGGGPGTGVPEYGRYVDGKWVGTPVSQTIQSSGGSMAAHRNSAMKDPYCPDCGVVQDLHSGIYCGIIRKQRATYERKLEMLKEMSDKIIAKLITGADNLLRDLDCVDARTLSLAKAEAQRWLGRNGGATTEKSSAVQCTSSGGSGGASACGGNGLGIAGAVWPPETRITVNGKTFCLADIDKEMTE